MEKKLSRKSNKETRSEFFRHELQDDTHVEHGIQARIQEFSQGWAPNDGLVPECYCIVHFVW